MLRREGAYGGKEIVVGRRGGQRRRRCSPGIQMGTRAGEVAMWLGGEMKGGRCEKEEPRWELSGNATKTRERMRELVGTQPRLGNESETGGERQDPDLEWVQATVKDFCQDPESKTIDLDFKQLEQPPQPANVSGKQILEAVRMDIFITRRINSKYWLQRHYSPIISNPHNYTKIRFQRLFKEGYLKTLKHFIWPRMMLREVSQLLPSDNEYTYHLGCITYHQRSSVDDLDIK